MASRITTFIRLSDRIINANMIKTISITPNQYYIEMISSGGGGSSGFFLGGSGWLTSNNNNCSEINIFKEKSPEDYKYLSDWIEKNI